MSPRVVVSFMLVVALWFSAPVRAQASIGGGLPQRGFVEILQSTAADVTAASGAIYRSTVAPGARFLLKAAPYAGKVVGWAGLISVGAEVVRDGLDWAYQGLQRQAGDPLSEWLFPGDTVPTYPVGDFGAQGWNTREAIFKCNVNGQSWYRVSVLPPGDRVEWFMSDSAGPHGATSVASDPCAAAATDSPPLSSVLDAHPELADKVNDIVHQYVQQNPQFVPTYLGYRPEPTTNQLQDRLVNCTDDSDHDGYTDCDEVAAGTDPGDSRSIPTPFTPGTTVVTNPDGSVTTTTVHDDGSKTVVTVSKAIDTVNNPDGSQTETTTTTTKTEEFNRAGEKIKADDIKTEKTVKEIPKEQVKTDEKSCTDSGGTWNSADNTCKPKEEDCPTGSVKQSDGTCKKDETDPGNECNDFSIPRFVKHPAAYIRDLFIPCDQWDNVFDELKDAVKDRFPFSMTSRLDHLVTFNGNSNQSDVLPPKIGPFDLDWSWIAPLLLVTSVLFKSAVGWIAINFVLSKLSGQLVMK